MLNFYNKVIYHGSLAPHFNVWCTQSRMLFLFFMKICDDILFHNSYITLYYNRFSCEAIRMDFKNIY